MCESTSNNRLSQWYERTAVQQIRPVDIGELTSQRYWEKWDRVTEDDLVKISKRFFERIWVLESPESDCLLFDTTNYYTFMASDTPSELARRGKNKEGRHNLRQVGLGLLVARGSRLPLYYCVYPGNLHDSRQFAAVMDEMFGVGCGFDKTKERLTVVIDKGMNSDGNLHGSTNIPGFTSLRPIRHTSRRTWPRCPLDEFELADIKKNRRMAAQDKKDDRILVYHERRVLGQRACCCGDA